MDSGWPINRLAVRGTALLGWLLPFFITAGYSWAGGSHGGRLMPGQVGMEPGWVSEFYRYRLTGTFIYLLIFLFGLAISLIYIRNKRPASTPGQVNLLNPPSLKKLAQWRGWPGILQLPAALVLLIIIAAGFWGPPDPERNLATVLTWQLWWVLLAFLTLFLGRAWCLACPVGAASDWAKRLASCDKELPPPLQSLWLQTVLLLVLTWAVTYWNWKADPFVTALLLTALVVAAATAGMLLKGRSFCRYLCPVSGMIGLYSRVAPLELRAKEKEVCQAHSHQDCVLGRNQARSCPWLAPPPDMENNAYCNFCLECCRACSLDNIRISLRPVGQDLWRSPKLKPDEAVQAFILFGVIFFQAITMLALWQPFKGKLLPFSLVYLAFALFLPGVMVLAWGLISGGLKLPWLGLAGSAMIPAGLAMMLVHNLDHLSFGLPTLSTVKGLFLQLLSRAGLVSFSVYTVFSPLAIFWLQLLILLAGFAFVLFLGYRWSKRLASTRQVFGVVAGPLVFTLLSLYVLGLPMSLAGKTGFPPGQKIAFISDRGGRADLFVMNPDSTGQTRLTSAGALEAAWSPDGSKLTYLSERDGNKEIYLREPDTGKETRLTQNEQDDWAMTWSPDGRKLAFVSGLGDKAEIFVIRPDGSGLRRLTFNSSWDYVRSWSPDGKRLLFESNRDGHLAVYVMEEEGANQTRLTHANSNDADPAFSPDGKKIVFSSDRDGNREIYIMDSDGGNQKRLTRHPAWDGHPYFSPDGTKILFESTRGKNGTFEVVIMYSNGGRQVLLTNNEYDDSHPSWSPDGRKVIFETRRQGRTQIYQVNADGTEEVNLSNSLANDFHASW